MGAPIGNRNATGTKSERPFADAIRRALAQYENKEAGIERGSALRRVADTLVTQAIAGDKDARLEIGNRLDGRPAQALHVSDPQGGPVRIESIQRTVLDPLAKK